MTAVAFIINILTLLIYQKMKIDWVGSGLIRELRAKNAPSRMERILLWTNDKSGLLIFIFLNIYQDPFITTAYFKEGNFSRITSRDFAILVASVLFSNAYWILVAAGIGQTVAFLWRYLL